MEMQKIIIKLRQLGRPDAAAGMAKYGITPDKVFGVSLPNLRALAKEIGQDPVFAKDLWRANYRETMILSGLVDDPQWVTEEQMEQMVLDFYDWEVCDQTVMNLFQKTNFAWENAKQWCQREEEFVRRAGFVLMARLAVSEKKAPDEKFEQYFPFIQKFAHDDRTPVKKAVSWALRQIGKRNIRLNEKAIEIGKRIKEMDCKSARWIASDVLRELQSEAVQQRLRAKSSVRK